MCRVTRRILKTRGNVGFFKIGEILQDLFRRHPAGKHFKHMAHRDSHATNRRFTTANVRFDRDTINMHALIYKNLRRTQSDRTAPKLNLMTVQPEADQPKA
jgi:hypothetical protein